MASTPLILLPPSEGKASGGDGPPLDLDTLSFGSLNPMRARIAKALVKISERPRSSKNLLGVKGPALEKAMAENAKLESASTTSAIERYTGVMYDAIDYPSMDADSRHAFDRSVVIMSGLFGMVRPSDMIPAYKLKMSGTLLRHRTCASVWKPLISKALAGEIDSDVVWDLLPNEHSAAWDSSAASYGTRFTVKFLERSKDGRLKTVSHFSKLLKGSLVRHLSVNIDAAGAADTGLNLVAAFSHPEGFKFHPELTTEMDRTTEIVFLRA
ncbi:MAG: peroxide stress protein YaaA [Chloroflexi bacterium]|nr:peroxide stress protein YaaA [Chloroflexota bacterium]